MTWPAGASDPGASDAGASHPGAPSTATTDPGAPGTTDPAAPTVVALDLGRTRLRTAIAIDGRIESTTHHLTADLDRDSSGSIIPAIVRCVEAIAATLPPSRRPAAIGCSVAVLVEAQGRLLMDRPFGLPKGPRLRDDLRAALGVPVLVDNDANMAAHGEMHRGAARDARDFVVVTLGTNIGGAVVIDRRVVRGAHHAAGEFGLKLVPARRGRDGRRATADAGRYGSGPTEAGPGYAMLEELAGGGALGRSASTGDEPVRDVFARAQAGDPRAGRVVQGAIEAWAFLIADLGAILDPELVVLSGGLADDATHVLQALRDRVGAISPQPPPIRLGELGATANLVGAALAASASIGTSTHEGGHR